MELTMQEYLDKHLAQIRQRFDWLIKLDWQGALICGLIGGAVLATIQTFTHQVSGLAYVFIVAWDFTICAGGWLFVRGKKKPTPPLVHPHKKD